MDDRKGEHGYSLIATAMLVILIGVMSGPGIQLYQIWLEKKRQTDLIDQMAALEIGLQSFLAGNGRYPCPSSLTAGVDEPDYGVEASADCTDGDVGGTFRTKGRGDRMVRIGAIPTRTLNITDDMMTDPWGHRFVYAVTENYTTDEAPFDEDKGAITVRDGADNSASAIPGNLVYVILSQGPDARGAYNREGILIEPCDESSKAGTNCNFDSDFANTVSRSYGDGTERFTHRVTYRAVALPSSCKEEITGKGFMPGNISYLVDTSGSMDSTEFGNCPTDLAGRRGCSRIDIARWALRRVIPARLQQAEFDEEAGGTDLTGFVADSGNKSWIAQSMRDIAIEDEAGAEKKIEELCPSGMTPLGVHIEALAERLGSGTEDRPNVVMVISDGLSNRGTDPVTVAKRISRDFPYLQVHIIDVVGTPSLKEVADITGGQYHLSREGDKLLDSLFALSGICTTLEPPPPPVDKPGCGSAGDWWK
jgi:hypothetical protein